MTKRFNKVLMANRGEIAVRILKTLKKMDIASVAIYSEADRFSMHVSLADEAHCVGGAPVSESYLNRDRIIEVLKQTGADAVHPGYGLLSENADFVEAVQAAGAVFVGPRAEHMTSFGLKDRARELADAAGVPLVPGTEPIEDIEVAIFEAEKIGFPVMLKAAAGGGGIGMVRCEDAGELRKKFLSVTTLAINNFGNGSVFLEKCIDRARHIEVQVFGNGKGEVLTLGTRDCSFQRRNQKVLEECPAPDLSDDLRAEIESSARRLCMKHCYENAGTVEFIYNCDDDQFYFLEVNTRLQVEHTVTEEVYGVDLVEWMLRQAVGDQSYWPKDELQPKGHAFQARIYAEDPVCDYKPCTGEVSHFSWPEHLRLDTWVSSGTEITPYYDPLMAKAIVHGEDRASAIQKLQSALLGAVVGGLQTNVPWLIDVLKESCIKDRAPTTKEAQLNPVTPAVVEIIQSGVQTTVQDVPGRLGMWDVGIPPSGPMDSLSFRWGNRLLKQDEGMAGLECLLMGPTLVLHRDTMCVVTGADVDLSVDGVSVDMWKPFMIKKGQTLKCGSAKTSGCRFYICFEGGLDLPKYLGSRSTFTLGKFGGFGGRPLLPGDTLLLGKALIADDCEKALFPELPLSARPVMSKSWEVKVLLGPHTSPEFFLESDISELLEAEWKVHFNSDRTGVRLIGPQPQWAREDGGEAGLHPSNIHDNAYAIGAMDFTGDQPVLLGPDGPSLGGFVCPVTICKADLWKMGQMCSDDTVKFIPISFEDAQNTEDLQNKLLADGPERDIGPTVGPTVVKDRSPILMEESNGLMLRIRQSGDGAILCEFGPLELDLKVRFHVHFVMLKCLPYKGQYFSECTPGIRSIQFQFKSSEQKRDDLMQCVLSAHREILKAPPQTCPSRIVHLPLSWDDPSTRLAIDKYVTSVRPDAPWCCPNNIEFIRRVNDLGSEQAVKEIVYDASYLVMGLGDVYLGAPVAVPMDPRHRLITTKYNPARTWTPENAVGIGGAYMCIYGMEGPGGYQFVGRTLPVWNRNKRNAMFTEPYLLRVFDQIRYYEVSPDELLEMRSAFRAGHFEVKIEESEIDLAKVDEFLSSIELESQQFKTQQTRAFEAEKQRWKDEGLFTFDAANKDEQDGESVCPAGAIPIVSPISGAVWKCEVEAGYVVKEDQNIVILEAMKMEMNVPSPVEGTLEKLFVKSGQTVQAGQCLGYITL
jgi:urea carboxylase